MNATEAMEVTGPSGGTLENIDAFYGPAVKALEDVDRGADDEGIKYAERQLKICNLRLSWATEIYMKEPNKQNSGLVNTWRHLRGEAEEKARDQA